RSSRSPGAASSSAKRSPGRCSRAARSSSSGRRSRPASCVRGNRNDRYDTDRLRYSGISFAAEDDPMRQALYQRQPSERVHVFDAGAMPWEETARPGLRLKTIRIDDDRGEFLGQIGFDPYIRSGLHQHQGVATSFILEGGLTDYHGAVNLHEMGINYRGSTHD